MYRCSRFSRPKGVEFHLDLALFFGGRKRGFQVFQRSNLGNGGGAFILILQHSSTLRTARSFFLNIGFYGQFRAASRADADGRLSFSSPL